MKINFLALRMWTLALVVLFTSSVSQARSRNVKYEKLKVADEEEVLEQRAIVQIIEAYDAEQTEIKAGDGYENTLHYLKRHRRIHKAVGIGSGVMGVGFGVASLIVGVTAPSSVACSALSVSSNVRSSGFGHWKELYREAVEFSYYLKSIEKIADRILRIQGVGIDELSQQNLSALNKMIAQAVINIVEKKYQDYRLIKEAASHKEAARLRAKLLAFYYASVSREFIAKQILQEIAKVYLKPLSKTTGGMPPSSMAE